jgi:hypothetical protein
MNINFVHLHSNMSLVTRTHKQNSKIEVGDQNSKKIKIEGPKT